MKNTLIPSLILACLGPVILSGQTLAADPAIAISISAPASGPGDAGRTILVEKESHFHVVLTNISDKVQRLVAERSSWGDQTLSFEITDESGKKFVVHKGLREYAKNMLHWWILEPGENLVLDVETLDPEWQPGFPHPPRYGDSQTVTMSAIFEVKEGSVPPGEKLWTGRVVSKPVKYVFSSRVPDAR